MLEEERKPSRKWVIMAYLCYKLSPSGLYRDIWGFPWQRSLLSTILVSPRWHLLLIELVPAQRIKGAVPLWTCARNRVQKYGHGMKCNVLWKVSLNALLSAWNAAYACSQTSHHFVTVLCQVFHLDLFFFLLECRQRRWHTLTVDFAHKKAW